MLHPPQVRLRELLQKKDKSIDEVHYISEDLQKLHFFDKFTVQNLKSLDLDSLLTFCQGLEYEKMPTGTFVYKKGDPSNEKYYFILSGQVDVIAPHEVSPISKAAESPFLKPQDISNPEGLENCITLNLAEQGGTLTKICEDFSPKNFHRSKTEAYPEASGSASPTRNRPRRLLKTAATMIYKDEKASPVGSRQGLRRAGTMSRIVSAVRRKKTEEKVIDITENQNNETLKEDLKNMSTKIIDETKEEVLEEVVDLTDPSQYEDYVAKLGAITATLENGNGFGEAGLVTAAARPNNALCRTECEFLVISKQNFDLVFQKREQEKENFLKSVFPLLAGEMISSSALVMILSMFKLETVNKGTYLTGEGKIAEKDQKLYIIYRGECLVEKNLPLEFKTPYNKANPVTKTVISTQIAVIGKGTLVGEEILVRKDEYTFNVKAVTENTQVYSITRNDFEIRLFKEFKDFVMGIYERKRRQRVTICENAIKEYIEKAEQRRPSDNAIGSQTIQIKHLINKPAAQGLNRYMQRGQMIAEKEPSYPNISTSQTPTKQTSNMKQTPKGGSSYLRLKTMEDSRSIDTDYQLSPQKTTLIKQKVEHMKEQEIENRLEYLSRLSLTKKASEPRAENEVEAVRLFHTEDPRMIRLYKHIQSKVTNRVSTPTTKNSTPKKLAFEAISPMIRGLARSAKKFRFIAPELGNIRQLHENDEQMCISGESLRLRSPASPVPFPIASSSKSVPKKRKTLQNVFEMYDVKVKRAATPSGRNIASAKFRQTYNGTSPYRTENLVDISSSSDASMSPPRFNLLQLDETDKQVYERDDSKEGLSPMKRSSTLTNLMSFENWGTVNRAPGSRNISSAHPSSPNRIKSEERASPIKYKRLHSQGHKSNGSGMHSAVEMRKKVFKKPSRTIEVFRIPIKNLMVLNTPVETPKGRK